METIPFYWKPFLYLMLFLLVEAIPFSGNHSFLWKPLPLVEDIPPSGSHCFSGNHSFLVKAIPYS